MEMKKQHFKWVDSQQLFTSWWLNHPSEQYARQIGSFPQVGMNI